MRVFLDKIYLLSGLLAGLFIVLIALMILAQIVGRWFGVLIPSTEDFSGFFLASSTFFALAYTFKSGGHIRVTLLSSKLKGNFAQTALILTLFVASFMVSYGLYHSINLTYESWSFAELSQGYIPVLLWIPQLSMTLGVLFFLVALVDDLIISLSGKTPKFVKLEE